METFSCRPPAYHPGTLDCGQGLVELCLPRMARENKWEEILHVARVAA